MKDKTINEKVVKFTGGASVGKEYELGEDVVFKVVGSVVRTEDSDNQDGTCDVTFKVKILTAEPM